MNVLWVLPNYFQAKAIIQTDFNVMYILHVHVLHERVRCFRAGWNGGARGSSNPPRFLCVHRKILHYYIFSHRFSDLTPPLCCEPFFCEIPRSSVATNDFRRAAWSAPTEPLEHRETVGPILGRYINQVSTLFHLQSRYRLVHTFFLTFRRPCMYMVFLPWRHISNGVKTFYEVSFDFWWPCNLTRIFC